MKPVTSGQMLVDGSIEGDGHGLARLTLKRKDGKSLGFGLTPDILLSLTRTLTGVVEVPEPEEPAEAPDGS